MEGVLSPDTPDPPKGVEWGRSESQQEEYYGKLLPLTVVADPTQRSMDRVLSQDTPDPPKGVEWGRLESQEEEYYGKLLL